MNLRGEGLRKASSIIVLSGLLVSIAFVAFAQTGGGEGGTIKIIDPMGGKNLSTIAAAITTALVTISIPIVGIMVIYGAFQIMTAGGDPKKFSDGKNTILYAAVGMAVILLANEIVALIKSIINGT